jgi:uncharacterized protein (DUF2236 family)
MLVRMTTAAPEFDIRRYLSGLGANVAGASNFMMQLSWPAVGYGVKDSKVESGSALKHPVKRARTTFTFLAVSMLGDERDRQVFRKAVNGQHAQVRSDPDSPVQYSAMDPRLQLWVAACLYYGTADLVERMHGALDDQTADALYQYCARFGTSLQVKQEMWPADRAAFAAYWEQSLAEVSVDEPVRQFLLGLMRYENVPRPLQRALARRNEFLTTGFLPPEFRTALGLTWSAEQEAKFDRTVRRLGRIDRSLPDMVRLFPFNALLWDMRRRHRKGIPLV